MGFIRIAKLPLVLVFSLILVLMALNLTIFDDSFYEKEFKKYDIKQDVPDVQNIHSDVINFLKGKSNFLPDDFNQREKEHLTDVKSLAAESFGTLLMLMVFFTALALFCAFAIKARSSMKGFMANVMIAGSILAIAFAIIVFLLISMDFSSSFESFHRLFFKQGTYLFDPKNELLVRMYPEQLFRDLSIKIGMNIFIASIAGLAVGFLLFRKSKSKKNKKN